MTTEFPQDLLNPVEHYSIYGLSVQGNWRVIGSDLDLNKAKAKEIFYRQWMAEDSTSGWKEFQIVKTSIRNEIV